MPWSSPWRRRIRALPSLALLLAAACAGDGGGPARVAVGPQDAGPGASLTLLLPAAPSPGGFPFPRDAGQALVNAQFYETLTALDARGRPCPALAADWHGDGRHWTFTLRADAQFWDGRPLEAADVVAAWLWTEHRAQARGLALPCAPLHPVAEHVSPVDSRHLEIELEAPCPDLATRLASPSDAISAAGPEKGWRLGSGPCRPLPGGPPGAALVCVPHAGHPRPARWAELRVAAAPPHALPRLEPGTADARLLFDRERADAYRALPGARVLTLADATHYLLVLPAALPLDAARLRAALARDAEAGVLASTTAEALPPVAADPGPLPWPGPAPDGPLRLAYDAEDPAAGDLARRLAALVSLPAAGAAEDAAPALNLLAAPLARDELDALLVALANPGPRAYAAAPAPLLLALRPGEAAPALLARDDLRVLPLVRTRPALALRDALAGLEQGGDGLLRLDRLGPAARRGERP